ncbi:DUF3540 domain-containing protein [Polyangium mundeleinium]|uniref:DUF3540 domain-containing protein n=1 Tax=Polyangium mundeleinium TaxID=2995306 RepID=A0ABT5ELL7_9BACT|nr:DUF3540 domain-containing protein [Polyangium mundeleinium]MDC0741596.1 DUF3540 domain-containing protein [Polyangium mundeleinium]
MSTTKESAAEAWHDGDDEAAPSGVIARKVLRSSDGAFAEQRGDAIELRDVEGRLLVRYENGAAEIAAPAGDLVFSAPAGRVVMRAGTDVTIEAARDLTQRAARLVETSSGGTTWTVAPNGARLRADRAELEAKTSHFVTGAATVVAQHIVTTAQRIATSVEKYELSATKLVETTRDAFREVADLADTKIGRARTLVRGQFLLRARRTQLVSKDETKVDGKKVLLG